MSSEIWQTIQDDLDELLDDPRYKKLHPLVDKWKQWSRAQPQPYPAEVFKIFIQSIKQMSADLKSGDSVDKILNKAKNGDYTRSGAAAFSNPNWSPDTVNQAQSIISFSINISSEELEEEAPDLTIEVPILLLVMNSKQAKELDDEKVFADFKDEPYADQFRKVRELLDKDWVKRYKQRPENWQPFLTNQSTIEHLVAQALDNIIGYEKRLVPKFIKIDNLVEQTNRRALRELRRDGCIIIMDVISMYHPDIQRTFRRALLDAYPNMFVLRVASTSTVLDVEHQLIRFSESYVDLEFYKRLTLDEDYGCEQVYQEFNLRRWLKSQVEGLVPSDLKKQVGIRKYQK